MARNSLCIMQEQRIGSWIQIIWWYYLENIQKLSSRFSYFDLIWISESWDMSAFALYSFKKDPYRSGCKVNRI